uniref:ATP-grasp domain-containing protein n=1 Tax=Aureoumbra lagunensis TaxID=44058 RepID=A0A7S3JTU7_9STRA
MKSFFILILGVFCDCVKTSALKPANTHITYESVILRELETEALPLVQRSNTEGGILKAPRVGSSNEVAIVVDITCDYLGRVFLNELENLGLHTVQIMSDYIARGLEWEYGVAPPEIFLSPREGHEEEWWQATIQEQFYCLTCCISESDSGIATAERIAAKLGARYASTLSPVRRHKWLLHETLKRNGLNACTQRLCVTIDDVRDFMTNIKDCQVVVKPARGVGSDGVSVCGTQEEAEIAFRNLQSTVRYAGNTTNSQVLLQKRLIGPEFAIDTVSRGEGSHKVVAVWRYEKHRLAPDAPRVYYCSELISDWPESICDAVIKALNATGHKAGPTHTELILDDTLGPTIVEINARFHNQNFPPITQHCLGLTQLRAAAIAASPRAESLWQNIPDRPPRFQGGGRIVHLVSYLEGHIESFNETLYHELISLPTVVDHDIYAQEPGQYLRRTVDVTTDAGWILLAADSKVQVDSDYETIINKMRSLYPSVTNKENTR